MANEFVIKNGYLSRGDSQITGSLVVTGGITGSLFGTASWAQNVISASYATTSSLPLQGIVTASAFMEMITFTKGDGSTFQITLSTGSVASASYSATASYVLPLVQNVTITGSLLLTGSHISEVDYIDFRNIGTSLPADQQGRIYWDDDNGTLSLGMHGGQVIQQVGLEEYYYIKNQTGVTLQNGSVIRAAGTLGTSGRILGDLMIANGTIPYFYTLGVVTEDIVDGDDGYVTQFGLVRGINTTGTPYGETWIDGDVLYVSPTIAGGLTKFEPEAPNLRIQMAIVVKAATIGSIFVRPDIGSDVGSLHDVINTTTTSSYGELFVKSGSVWTSTKQLTGSYGITGSLDITGSLFVKSQDTIVATNYPNSDPGEISLDTDAGSFNSAYLYLQKVDGQPSRSYGELSAMSPKGRLNFMVDQQAMGIVVSKDTDAIQPTGILIFDNPAGVPVLQQGTYIYISGSNIENFGDVYVTGSLTVSSSLNVKGSTIITGSLIVKENATDEVINSVTRTLKGIGGTPSVDWDNKDLYDTSQQVSLDWENKTLEDGGVTNLNWASRETYDNTSTISINWNDRTLFDDSGTTPSVNWNGRTLYDSTGDSVLDWQTRQFNGTSSLATTASFALTASHITPLVQNVLITGSTNLNGALTTKTTRITGSSYTASINDYRIGIRYTSTGSVSIQLPLISQVGQIEYRFKDEEGNATVNNITLVASGSNLIDGSSTAILRQDYIAVGLYNDGTSNWYIE